MKGKEQYNNFASQLNAKGFSSKVSHIHLTKLQSVRFSQS